MMNSRTRITLAATLILLGVYGQASAQYLKITTDNPTDPTRLRSSGSTLLTITLDTNHDRDGSLQTCNSHTAANCGASTTGQSLDMFSYTLAFRAVSGTVQWGTFVAADPVYITLIPQIQNDTEVEINMYRPVGSNPPGRRTLGTIPVTVVAGVPTIGPQIGPGALNPFGFGCGFGTSCDGYFFPNTYVLGNASDPCGTTTFPGDWFDFDGVTAGPSETPLPQITAPANAEASEGTAMTPIEATATDPDGSQILTITQTGMPADLTFSTDSPGPSPRHATVSGTPGYDDANVPEAGLGFYRIAFTVSDGGFGAATAVTALIVTNTNRAPILNPIPNMTISGGEVVDQAISGSDPDGNALTFSKGDGPPFMIVTTTSPTTGNIHLAPPSTYPIGDYAAAVHVDDGHFGTADQSFTLTVTHAPNRCPVSRPGGPYTGTGSTPIVFDGSGSFDPDGNPLNFAWDFDSSDGIQVDAVGASVTHGYPAAGIYTVTLTVTDNGNGDPAQVCSASATTTADVKTACPADVFSTSSTIRLIAGRSLWYAYVEPQSLCYSNSDVIVSSFVMKYGSGQIPAELSKVTVGGDRNNDGVPEIRIAFSMQNLRTLFSGLPDGHNPLLVTVEADLVTGARLSGSIQVDVVSNAPGFTAATVSPNPLNPEATLTYTTTRSGPVRIDMFDIQGRLVKRLVDDPAMGAGTHQAAVRGEKLPSGVYYIRGVSTEGEFKRLVTILK